MSRRQISQGFIFATTSKSEVSDVAAITVPKQHGYAT
jgi:hypothetical protein